MSACARAGASFIPSPTIATILPSSCNLFISLALSPGSTSANTRFIPTCFAIAFAVLSLSPVIMITSRPIFWSVFTASVEYSIKVSATAIMPTAFLSTAISIAVFPSSSNAFIFSSRCPMSMSSFFINFRFPSNISMPLYFTSTPCPGMALKNSGSVTLIPLSIALFTIASPRGCSELFSATAASCNSCSSLNVLTSRAVGDGLPIGGVMVTMSVTSGSPFVSVPVLSNTIAWSLWAVSKASPLLIKIPFSAPFPTPTMMAVGVARPIAHGHAIINTAMNTVRANMKPIPTKYHTRNESVAVTMTAGTKRAATASTNVWMGALEPNASSTSLMIWARTVSAPTLVALNLSMPVLFIVAPTTSSPTFFSTGMLSPVITFSSTPEYPWITTPSTGIFSPGLTATMSPTWTSSTGTSISSPSLTTLAVLACNPISFLIAADVLPLAIASNSLPKMRNVISDTAVV